MGSGASLPRLKGSRGRKEGVANSNSRLGRADRSPRGSGQSRNGDVNNNTDHSAKSTRADGNVPLRVPEAEENSRDRNSFTGRNAVEEDNDALSEALDFELGPDEDHFCVGGMDSSIGLGENTEVDQAAEMFASTTMSLEMENEDLLFNLLYFGGTNTMENLGGVLSGALEGTIKT